MKEADREKAGVFLSEVKKETMEKVETLALDFQAKAY